MRILIIGLNFFPELTGIGKYTGELASFLSEHGHQLRVITAPPYYPQWKIQKDYSSWRYHQELWQGIDIYRCPLWVPETTSGIARLILLASFAFSSIPVLVAHLTWRPALVLCIAPNLMNAPFALTYAHIVGAKKWLHIQDFEIDAAIKLGMLPTTSWFKSFAAWLEYSILRRFDLVSTLSDNMVALTIEKGVQADRAFVLPNWVDTQQIFPLGGANPMRVELNIPDDKIIILYHGNMGRKQGLEILVTAAKYLKDNPEILFILSGDGVARKELEFLARGLPNILFLEVQLVDKLNLLVNLADIHVLPQLADAADLVMPSKLTSMLASGKAVIACANPGTQVWKVVNKVGCVVPPSNARSLVSAILDLAADLSERKRMGSLGRSYAEQYLDREIILLKVAELVNSLSLVKKQI